MRKYIPMLDPKPARVERNLPVNKGSVKILVSGIMSHMNRGCLPSEIGRNLRVESARMTWDHLM